MSEGVPAPQAGQRTRRPPLFILAGIALTAAVFIFWVFAILEMPEALPQ